MIWLLCALMITAPTRSGTLKDRLQAAEKAFDRYEYDAAIRKLEALLADRNLADRDQRQYARVLLAFSLFWAEKRDLAAAQLQILFAENAAYPLAREDTHPDLLRFFDAERATYLSSQPSTPPPAAQAKPETLVVASEPASQPIALATQPAALQSAGDRHPWVRIFPAGVGHFANHDFAAGGVFLALEAALLTTHLTFGALHNQMQTSDGRYYRAGSTNALAFQIVTNVAGLAAIALAVIDILDAFLWSPARGRSTLHPIVSLGPLGDFRLALQ